MVFKLFLRCLQRNLPFVLLLSTSLTLLAQGKTTGTPRTTGNKATQAQLHAAQAMEHFNKKEYDKAIEYFERALKTDKDNSDYEYEIALAYVLKNDIDKAIPRLRTIIKAKDAKDNYYQLLGNLYAEKGDTAMARSTYTDGLNVFKKSGRLRMELGMMRLQERLLDEALDEFEEGIQTEPTYYLNYYWAARSYSGTTEKLWSLLYSELFMITQPTSTRLGEMSRLYYDVQRKVFEEFDESKNKMLFSKAQKGGTDASQLNQNSFEDEFNNAMSIGARMVKFNRDFEIPISALDTIHTQFITSWFAQGLDKKFPNPVISRWKVISDKGLLRAYHYYLMQYAKPLEFEDYLQKNKKEYNALLLWLEQNPLKIDENNKFSRFFY